VEVDKSFTNWWHKYAYLIVIDKIDIGEIVNVPATEEFNSMISQHVKAYVENGKMPPKDIAPAILNLADDFIAGREVTVRAGDYISLQTHFKKAK
jgi:hypothetical protein